MILPDAWIEGAKRRRRLLREGIVDGSWDETDPRNPIKVEDDANGHRKIAGFELLDAS